MSKKKATKGQNLNEIIRMLEERVLELESSVDSNTRKIMIVQEFLEILNDVSFGKALLNRAMNRVKLKHLKYEVIPRRQNELLKLQADRSISQELQEQFTAKQIDLLMKAHLAVKHRETYEKKASNRVITMFQNLQRFLSSQKKKALNIQLTKLK